jgi:hypothetical protein
MFVNKVLLGDVGSASRSIAGVGRCLDLFKGKQCDDAIDKQPQKIASLEYFPASGVVIIRKTYEDGKPSRSWNSGAGESQRNESDACAVSTVGATVYLDDEPPPMEHPATLPQCSKCGKDSQGEPVCVACSLEAQNAIIAERAKASQDPPPAQPIQKQNNQGQPRR